MNSDDYNIKRFCAYKNKKRKCVSLQRISLLMLLKAVIMSRCVSRYRRFVLSTRKPA